MTPLTTLIKQYAGSIPEEKVIKVGMDICSALILVSLNISYIENIKPENIMVSEFGDYKLGDSELPELCITQLRRRLPAQIDIWHRK